NPLTLVNRGRASTTRLGRRRKINHHALLLPPRDQREFTQNHVNFCGPRRTAGGPPDRSVGPFRSPCAAPSRFGPPGKRATFPAERRFACSPSFWLECFSPGSS